MTQDYPFREAWKNLGDMNKTDAETEYIKLVKEVDPQWDTKQNTVTVCCKI